MSTTDAARTILIDRYGITDPKALTKSGPYGMIIMDHAITLARIEEDMARLADDTARAAARVLDRLGNGGSISSTGELGNTAIEFDRLAAKRETAMGALSNLINAYNHVNAEG